MLCELRVENLLLIERAELRLARGLNVLTGETGAGKTVLAHALDLLLGGRAKPGIVRPGAAEAYVEGVFELPGALRGRPPSSRSSACASTVLPAPVSPVIAFRPPAQRSSARSISSKFWTRNSASIVRRGLAGDADGCGPRLVGQAPELVA